MTYSETLYSVYSAYLAYLYSHPSVAQVLIICLTIIVVIMIFAIGSKFKWFHRFSIGKSGIQLQAPDQEKQLQSGSMEHLLRDMIHNLDMELMDFALDTGTILRRGLTIEFNKNVDCLAMRKSLSFSLRYPLFHASLRNNFKLVLRPENITFYIERLVKEIALEYEEYAVDHSAAYCTVNNETKCPPIPKWEDIKAILEKRLLEDWALPIKQKNIDICHKKIDTYRQFIKSFKELGDVVKVKVTENCIDKNRGYIEAFVRKPELRTN